MKKNKTILKELREELLYEQMQTRMAVRHLQRCKDKCKEIGSKMRKIHLGKYSDAVEAALVYDAHAKDQFGELAIINFPGENL